MKEKTNLHSDQPIKTASEDKFGRVQFANRIADVVILRDDPSSIVISVNAPWGDGKTSVLNMITGRLRENNITILPFNPWRFQDEEKLLKSFFLSLAAKLDIKLETKREKTGGFLRKKGKIAAIARLVGIGGDEIVAGLSELFPDPDIDELKKRIEEKLHEKKKLVVVLMDDIDRLDVTEIHAVFRLIKLTASFPYSAYILAFDNERVAQALAEKYGDITDSGKNFLEKIVQVSLPLPPVSSKALMTLTVDGINSAIELAQIETSKEDEERFSEFFDKAFRSRIGTPRLSKRFTNAIKFALPLMKGEVNHLDLVFIEAIKTFYPKLYSAIRENGDLILEFTIGDELFGMKNESLQPELERVFKEALSDIRELDRAGIEALMQNLIPNLSSLKNFQRPHSVPLRENELIEKRFSIREYFWRYFSYGVQPHDISDNEISDFLRQVGSNESEFAAQYLEKFFLESSSRIDVVVNKLRLHEDKLDSETSEKLALGISSLSDKFPAVHPDDRVFSHGLRYQIARLIVHLARSLKDEKRHVTLIRIAQDTPSLSFAFDLAEMVSAFGEKIDSTDDTWAIRWNGIEREVNRIVSSRIASQARKTTLEDFDFRGSIKSCGNRKKVKIAYPCFDQKT